MTNNQYLVDVFDEIVSDVREDYDTQLNERPYYLYGHPLDINNVLTQKSNNAEFKYKKYPLIALVQDFTETHGSFPYFYTASPKILIVHSTQQAYNSEQRYENVFKTILYPIYNKLIQNLLDSRLIDNSIIEQLPHKKTDRLYWGKAGIQGNERKIFNDFLDAIEIDFTDLKIIRQITTCQRDWQP